MASGTISRPYTPQIMVVQYTATYSVTANGNQTVPLSDFKDENNQTFSPPTGYSRLGIMRCTSGDANVVMRGYDIWNAGGGIYFTNLASSAANNKTASLYISWIRNA